MNEVSDMNFSRPKLQVPKEEMAAIADAIRSSL